MIHCKLSQNKMNTKDSPIKMNPQSFGLTSGILSTHGGIRLELPGGRRTQEKYFVLETENSEKRRPVATEKNQENTHHKGVIKHL